MKKFQLISLIAIVSILLAFSLKDATEGREFDREIPVIAMAVDQVGGNGIECSQCHAGKREDGTAADILLINDDQALVAGGTYEFEIHFADDLDAQGVEMQLLAFEKGTQTSLGGFEFAHERHVVGGIAPNGDHLEFEVAHQLMGTGKTNKPQTISWTAPEHLESPVSINIAGLAANLDGTTDGDESFGASFVLYPSEMQPNSNVYPSHISDRFTVESYHPEERTCSIQLFNMSGEIVTDFGERYLPEGSNTMDLQLTAGLPGGMYLLAVQENNEIKTHQVYVK
jgi:hypothetical protein